MKKLMIALAAAATAIGLYAAGEGFKSGNNFNDLTAGDAFVGDAGGVWTGILETDNQNKISDVESGLGAQLRPDYWRQEEQGNNLAIKTKLEEPIYRSVGATEGPVDMGVYFDAAVKFTSCDPEENTVTLPNGTKIGIYLKADAEDETKSTLHVVAGTIGETVTSTDFDCGEFADPDAWHRLTVKTIADIGSGTKYSGFVVFTNGAPVECTAAAAAHGSVELNAKANAWNETGSLFVSLVANDATVSDIGFAGQGWVDDIVFTTDEPTKDQEQFAKDSEFATVAWTPANVTSVTINNKTLSADELAKGAYNALLTDGKFTIAWIGSATKTDSDTQTVDAADLTDNTFDIDEEIEDVVALVGTAKYDDLDEAVTYANQAKEAVVLKLIKTTSADDIAIGNSNVLIDLNGQTIGSLGDELETEDVVLNVANSNEGVDGIISGSLNYDVDISAVNVRINYAANSMLIKMGLVNVTVPTGYVLKAHGTEYYEIVPAYAVTAATGLTGGSVAVDKTTAAAGETVTITVTANEGYTFASVSVMGTTAIQPTEVVAGVTYTFVMPAEAVSVSATFTKDATEITEGDVALSASAFTYNGQTQKPSVTVTVGGNPLTEDVDYTLTNEGGKNVDTYTVTVVGKGDYKGTVAKQFAITKVAITVTANDKEMTAGGTVPTFDYQITSGALVDGESLTGTLGIDGADTTKPGDYQIVQNDDWENDNYEITYEPGTLTVNPAGPDPVDPSDPNAEIKPPEDKQPADYADDINKDPELKAKLMADPADVKFEGNERALYQSCFKAAPTETGVRFVLDETATVGETGKTLAELATAGAAVALTGDTVTITAVKGLWYGLKEAGELDKMAVTAAEQAKDETITFEPVKEGDANFWQVIVQPTEISVENN